MNEETASQVDSASVVDTQSSAEQLQRDVDLFSKGREHFRDPCPICFLPMPVDPTQSIFNSCCTKLICKGCVLAARRGGLGAICVFCRTPRAITNEATIALVQQRADAGDAEAILTLGHDYFYGNCGLPKDIPRAVE